ncbi:MAG: trigger factor [Deltaproteobacteria bacterium]|nr:trigger factor [Deltaproteobacteria bacterium]
MEVTSSVTDLDQVTKQFKVSIPAEKVIKESESALTGYTAKTKIKGFRPGKAPRDLVEKLHGAEIRLEVANRLISSTLNDLIKEHKLDVVGDPDVQVDSVEPGKQLEYTAKVSIFPNPEIKKHDKFKVKVTRRDAKDADIDHVIEDMRKGRATPQKLAFRNKAQKDDVIDAMLVVEVEGEEPSRPEPLAVVLGAGTLPADVEEQVIGMEIGESKEITSKIPDLHPNQQIRGKNAKFKITLNSLSEQILPELDDKFVESLNMGVGTVLELRMKIRKELEEYHAREIKKDTQAAVLDQLLEEYTFQVPQSLIDDEIRSILVRNGVMDPNQRDISRLSMEPFREKLGDTAARRVRGAIIVDQIGKLENLKASDEDINAAMDEIAKQNGVTIDDVRKYFLTQERGLGFLLEITRNKVLDFLVSRAEVDFVEPSTEPAADAKEEPKAKAKKAKK